MSEVPVIVITSLIIENWAINFKMYTSFPLRLLIKKLKFLFLVFSVSGMKLPIMRELLELLFRLFFFNHCLIQNISIKMTVTKF